MKRKHTVTLVAAALIAALLCGTALAAATGFSLRDMFSQMDADGRDARERSRHQPHPRRRLPL